MALKDEIEKMVDGYMNSTYEITDAYSIPDKNTLSLGATAKDLSAIIMFIDIRESRLILGDHKRLFAIRAHKSLLYIASKCVRNEDGHIRSFGGDSMFAFFKGENSEKRAVRCAMKIKSAVINILNPILESKESKEMDFGIGIARGDFLVAKSGVSGNEMYQDLIWIGWPMYHALEYGNKAKSPRNIWISNNIYNTIKEDKSMVTGSDGNNMWVYEDDIKFSFGNFKVYKTSYSWSI